MPKLGVNFGVGVNGNQGGPSTGSGLPSSSMYGALSSMGQAPAHVITGELMALVVLELFLLGFIRFTFLRNFGG